MLNLYNYYEKPEELSEYDSEAHVNMVFKMFNDYNNDYAARLTNDDKKILAKNIDVIIKDPRAIYMYAKYIIKGRWEEAEDSIMKDPRWAAAYALYVIKGRFEKAEPYIMKSPKYACNYARDVLKHSWEEAEQYIKEDPESAYLYAYNVIKGRFEKAEPYIMKDPGWWRIYKRDFGIE